MRDDEKAEFDAIAKLYQSALDKGAFSQDDFIESKSRLTNYLKGCEVLEKAQATHSSVRFSSKALEGALRSRAEQQQLSSSLADIDEPTEQKTFGIKYDSAVASKQSAISIELDSLFQLHAELLSKLPTILPFIQQVSEDEELDLEVLAVSLGVFLDLVTCLVADAIALRFAIDNPGSRSAQNPELFVVDLFCPQLLEDKGRLEHIVKESALLGDEVPDRIISQVVPVFNSVASLSPIGREDAG